MLEMLCIPLETTKEDDLRSSSVCNSTIKFN